MAPPRKPYPVNHKPKKSNGSYIYRESPPSKDPDSLDPKLLVENKRRKDSDAFGRYQKRGPARQDEDKQSQG